MANDKFYKSKTKWAALLLVATEAVKWYTGSTDLNTVWTALIAGLGVFGIRDALGKK